MIAFMRLVTMSVGWLILVGAFGCTNEAAGQSNTVVAARPYDDIELPRPLAAEHLPNAIRIHQRVISGGKPEGEAAFRELRSLGVKTIISVDGAKPDVALAAKHGLRYIHLPHGYNGIPDTRVNELAKAVHVLKGPFYIHCHHGKHRSPAAATVTCVANGLLDPLAAVGVLKLAGTSEHYQGLYQSVASARRIDSTALEALEVDFREIAKLPPLAKAMVDLEQTHDNLKRFAAADWKFLHDDPDQDPAHEALLLKEHFAELSRMESIAKKPAEFRELLKRSEIDSREMETMLRAQHALPEARSTSIHELFTRVTANCTACHRQFRDVPLKE